MLVICIKNSNKNSIKNSILLYVKSFIHIIKIYSQVIRNMNIENTSLYKGFYMFSTFQQR